MRKQEPATNCKTGWEGVRHYRPTCSLDAPLLGIDMSVSEEHISSLAVLLRKACPRLSRSQATGWMTGSLSPAKTMAVRRARSGLASSVSAAKSPGRTAESQYTGDTKRTW